MVAQTDDKVMNKAVFILKKMSADEKMREVARIRERALHDEASYLQDAREAGFNMGRAEGRAEGIEKMLEILRNSGFDENVLKEAAARASL